MIFGGLVIGSIVGLFAAIFASVFKDDLIKQYMPSDCLFGLYTAYSGTSTKGEGHKEWQKRELISIDYWCKSYTWVSIQLSFENDSHSVIRNSRSNWLPITLFYILLFPLAGVILMKRVMNWGRG